MNHFLMMIFAIGLMAFILSLVGTKFLIRRSKTFGLIDVPNDRSSHVNPTPRGGGLAFVLAFISGGIALYGFGLVQRDWLLPVLFGGPLIALIGWMDDRSSMSAGVRLLTHFASALLVYTLITRGFTVGLTVSFVPDNWPVLTFVFSMLFVAWMINLYNFMDGIDGLAAGNAVVVAFSLAGISAWQSQWQLTAIYVLLGFSVLGFLIFNWSPAKIFMGDSGSTFLGFAFAAIALTGKGIGNVAFIANVIALGCFIVDATYTLLMRAWRGKKVWQAHRDHAFQHAIQMGWSHRRTVMFYGLITMFWLFPLSIGALIYEKLALLFLVIAYLPLIAMQIHFKAGIEGQLPLESKLFRLLGRENSLSKREPNVGA